MTGLHGYAPPWEEDVVVPVDVVLDVVEEVLVDDVVVVDVGSVLGTASAKVQPAHTASQSGADVAMRLSVGRMVRSGEAYSIARHALS